MGEHFSSFVLNIFIQCDLQLSQDTVDQFKIRWPCLSTYQQQLGGAVIWSCNLLTSISKTKLQSPLLLIVLVISIFFS